MKYPKSILNCNLWLEQGRKQLIATATFRSLTLRSKPKCTQIIRDSRNGTSRFVSNLVQAWGPNPQLE